MEMLLIIHIASMSLSLLLMSSAVLLALASMRRSVSIASLGFIATCTGTVTGLTLLLEHPLLLQCMALTIYLAMTAVVYGYGFGWGRETRARLLKT